MQGGLRLAATLNAIFAPPELEGLAGDVRGLLNLEWLEEAEAQGL